MKERCTIKFKGRVQGVGFRFTACHVAGEYPELTGWVRNESDGSVTMVVEGARRDIEACLRDLRLRMRRNIESERVEWSKAEARYETFVVRY